jgi:hypothetical protein
VSSKYVCVGKSSQKKLAYWGCSGSSALCSMSSSNWTWTSVGLPLLCKNGCDVKAGKCKPDAAQCTKGTCCNIVTKKFQAAKTKCGPVVMKTEYKCKDAKSSQNRKAYYGCTGKSASCNTTLTYYHWTGWTGGMSCPFGCNGKTGQCELKPGKQCTSGACCTILTGTYKKAKTKCGGAPKKTEYKCGGLGSQKRTAYLGCSGKSSGCSLASADWSWSSWSPGSICPNGCDSKIGKCKAAAVKQCTTGSCCNLLSQKYRGQKTKCGSAVKKTEYKCGGLGSQTRKAYWGCSGKSSTCSTSSSNWHWTDWSAGVLCLLGCDSKSGQCKKSSAAQCTVGICCDTAKKLYKTKATKCGTKVAKSAYKCDGKKLSKRSAYAGCSGSSALSCSSLSSNYYWTSYALLKTCTSKQICKTTGTCTNASDLYPTAVKSAGTVYNKGSTMTVEFSIKNIGGLIAFPHRVGIYLSTNTTISISDIFLGYYQKATLLNVNGSYKVISKKVTVPSNTKAGSYYMGVYADYQKILAEANESNNGKHYTKKITVK